jgi:hypothetical protein
MTWQDSQAVMLKLSDLRPLLNAGLYDRIAVSTEAPFGRGEGKKHG